MWWEPNNRRGPTEEQPGPAQHTLRHMCAADAHNQPCCGEVKLITPMVGKPTYFLDFHPFAAEYLGSWKATTTLGFVTWIIDATNTATDVTVFKPLDSNIFDDKKPHVFSHGDLVPENILVHDGHISGIIDWEYAGWYPYFWNPYIALRRPLVDSRWTRMIRNIMVTYNRERQVFSDVYETACLWVGT